MRRACMENSNTTKVWSDSFRLQLRRSHSRDCSTVSVVLLCAPMSWPSDIAAFAHAPRPVAEAQHGACCTCMKVRMTTLNFQGLGLPSVISCRLRSWLPVLSQVCYNPIHFHSPFRSIEGDLYVSLYLLVS